MASLYRQVAALSRKNFIVMWRHKWLNLFRCLLLPLFFSSYVAQTQGFYDDQGERGPGHIGALRALPSDLEGLKLVYTDPTGSGGALLQSALAHAGVSRIPLQVGSQGDIPAQCPSSLNGVSYCFAAVMFENVDLENGHLNYTLRSDKGLDRMSTEDLDKDDFQKRLLPLQWAIESTFINLTTGMLLAPPQTWAYTNITKTEWEDHYKRDFVKDIRGVNVISWVIAMVWIVYHIAGRMAAERGARLTEHLETMGCRTSARYISWILSLSLAHLGGWLASAGIWFGLIWKHTNALIVILTVIIAGLSNASWATFVAAPFSRAPTITAILVTGLYIGAGMVGYAAGSSAAAQGILAVLLPPAGFVAALRNWSSWHVHGLNTNIVKKSPDGDCPVIALLIINVVNIFIYPVAAAYLERVFHGIPPTHAKNQILPPGVAVELRNVSKTYTSRRFVIAGRKRSTVAIQDLSLDVPRGGIFCLLGRNGSAKSTTLGAIAQLIPISGGTVRYAPDLSIGFASQKDVLWDDLTCAQHLRLWREIKGVNRGTVGDDVELIERCNLTPKKEFLAKKLSGGQKRKLQLACALAGESNLLLLDEISSGLDPLSRRAIWKVIASYRGSATIVLTTHFLDEADYLGDQIAILRAPGRLLAIDSPVGLKTRLGHGYTLSVDDAGVDAEALLSMLREEMPTLVEHRQRGKLLYYTGSNDVRLLRRLVRRLQHLRSQGYEISYQIGNTTLEEVFIDLNSENTTNDGDSELTAQPTRKSMFDMISKVSTIDDTYFAETALEQGFNVRPSGQLALSSPVRLPWWRRAPSMVYTLFLKRVLLFTRSWLIPVGCVFAVVLVSTIPLVFMRGRRQTCDFVGERETVLSLTYPDSVVRRAFSAPLVALGDSNLENWTAAVGLTTVAADAFENTIKDQMRTLSSGGLALTRNPAEGILAWENAKLEYKGTTMMNLYTNSLLEQLRPDSNNFRITTNFQPLPSVDFSSTGKALLWATFFGFIMAIWPAFAAVYPTQEKMANVRANQYSNGAKPAAVWASHLLFELPFIILIASLIAIGFAASSQFNAVGIVWICLILYGISSTLQAYTFSFMSKSPLGAWAAVALWNAFTFIIYYLIYMFVNLLNKDPDVSDTLSKAHYGSAAIGPLPSIVRTVLVSLNTFNLLCDGFGKRTTKPNSDMAIFGAPIVYMIAQSFIYFGILVYVDSGAPVPFRRFFRRSRGDDDSASPEDVVEETKRVVHNRDDALRVEHVSKKYGHGRKTKPALTDVSFGVRAGDTFALIGPNGAGKTTMLACIRGVEWPTRGDITVLNRSIVGSRNKARLRLGVCPQINAIDDNLTVRQHLWLYGRLKGVPTAYLGRDIAVLLATTGLAPKADDLATSLSGGNQRKLSLAIALMGGPPVILIDEFSSGVDPFSKREAWSTLASLTRERAVVITTHSMEEVDALANRVGILATTMLSVGTPASLKARYAAYELHIPSVAVDPAVAFLHEHGFSRATRALDTQTRVSLPGVAEDQLDALLAVLERMRSALDIENMAVHEASTENAFLSIVREHNVKEDNARDEEPPRQWFHRRRRRVMANTGGGV